MPPRSSTPSAVDLGAAQSVAGENETTVTVALKLRDTEQLDSLQEFIEFLKAKKIPFKAE
jgi:hypothetical protein